MDSSPLVSIIIPTRNRRELLEHTLASVQCQSYPHWQAIVVDDGSADQTDAMMRTRFGDDARIQYCQRQGAHPGANVCRNEGFAASAGQYVLFLDSDDLLAPPCLQRRVIAMQAEVELDFVAAYAEYFQFQPGDLHRMHNIATDQNPIDRFLLLDYPWQTSSLLWRRAALARLRPWDERLPSWQDWELHLRALIGGVKYRWLPAVDFYVRIARGDGSSTSQQQSRSPAHLLAAPPLFAAIRLRLLGAGLYTPQRARALAALHLRTAQQWLAIGKFNRAAGVLLAAHRQQIIGVTDLLNALTILVIESVPGPRRQAWRRLAEWWRRCSGLRTGSATFFQPIVTVG